MGKIEERKWLDKKAVEEGVDFDKVKGGINDNFEKGGGIRIVEFKKLETQPFYIIIIDFVSSGYASNGKSLPFKISLDEIMQLLIMYGLSAEEENYLEAIQNYITDCVDEAFEQVKEPEKLSYLKRLSKLENEFCGFVKLSNVEIFTIDANNPVLTLDVKMSRKFINSGDGEFKVNLSNEGVVYFVSKYFGVKKDVIKDIYLKDGEIKLVCFKKSVLITEQLETFQYYVEEQICKML